MLKKIVPYGYIFSIIGLCLILIAYSQQAFIYNINSDILYDFETAYNLVLNKSIAGQNFPVAPYFFPDQLLVILLQFFSHNYLLLHAIYSFIFMTSYCTLVYLIIRTTSVSRHLALLGTLLALSLSFLIVPQKAYFLKEWPMSHLSVILYSLFFLFYYLKNDTRPISFIKMGILFLLTFLVFISDNLLFAQLLFPFALLMGLDLLYKNGPRQFNIILLTMFLVVVLIGAKFTVILEHYFGASFYNQVSLFRVRKLILIQHTLSVFFEIIKQNVLAAPVFYLMLIFYNVTALFLLSFAAIKKLTIIKNKNFIFTIKFLFLSQICNIVLAVLVGKMTDVAHVRYLDTIYFFSPLALVIVILQFINHKKNVNVMNLIAGLFFATSVFLFIAQNSWPKQVFQSSALYNQSVQCMDLLYDKYHIKNGLAEYWSVRPVRMLTKNKINVAQISPQLKLFNLIDNEMYFHHGDYQFIIVNNLPQSSILQKIGQPDKIISCPKYEVWLYVSLSANTKLNQYFMKQSI